MCTSMDGVTPEAIPLHPSQGVSVYAFPSLIKLGRIAFYCLQPEDSKTVRSVYGMTEESTKN